MSLSRRELIKLSALAAAFIAWSQLRQHGLLAGIYQAQAVQMRDFARTLNEVTSRFRLANS